MSRRALKRVWKPLHAHADARIRIHDSADSLPHAALVRADRPTFDCPRCGWQNDRAPFCLWCLCQDEDEFKTKWQRPLRRRITSPSLVCPVPPTPPARRPFSSPAPPSSSAPPAPPISPPPTATPTPTCPATADDDNFNGRSANVVDTTYMSIPSPFPLTTTLTATTTITSAKPAPCTPPASPLLSTTNRVRYPSAASSTGASQSPTAASPLPWPPTASSASTSQTQSPPLSPTSTKFSAYVSRKTAEREARMHRIAECANAAAVTLDIGAPLAPPPAPGAIALGHLLPIPGSLRISNVPPGGNGGTSVAGGSRTSLDLRSVRSREADSLYSPARSVASRSSAGVGLGGGGRRSRSVHRRGESSQYSLAPPLPSPAEISDEDVDADVDDELATSQSLRGRSHLHSDATAGRGKRAAATAAVEKFFRRVGGAMHLPHMPQRGRGRGDAAQHAREDGGEPGAAVAPGEGERAAVSDAGGMRDGVAAAVPAQGGVSGVSAKSGVGRLLEWTSAAWGKRRRR